MAEKIIFQLKKYTNIWMNTDSIMAVWIFCFGAVWAARPVLKNNIVGILWAILKGVFFIFSGAKHLFFFFFENVG